MIETFFTSDEHFNHIKMVEHRGFNSKEEMNETIIENFNKKVPKNGLTYIQGDFSWSESYEFFERLNGKFIFIYGNHDTKIYHPRIQKIIKDGYLNLKINDQKVTLCHFAMHSWNCSHWGAWHLYGHHHYKSDFGGKTMNVSVDANDFSPIHWDEVVQHMNNRPDNWDLIKK